MFVALGEVEAGVLHVGAGLGGDDVERLLGQPAAEVDRNPFHARVAADLHPPRGQVVDLPATPVLVVREVDLRARVGVQLERARMERLALEVGGEEVLADLALRVVADDRQRVRPLRRAGLVDPPDHLDRLLDALVGGHVDEHAARPQGGGARGELALVVREALREVLAHEVRVLLDRLLERHDDDAVVEHVHVHDAGAALDDQGSVLLVAEVELGEPGLVALRLERVEIEAAQRRGPEAGATPGRQRLGLEDLQRGAAALVHELRGGGGGGVASRHSRPPPRARTRSPSPRARPPAPARPRARSCRRS